VSREQLVRIARRNIEHQRAGTQDQAEGIHAVPARNYVDPDRWTLEVDRVFRRLPLVVATSAELREPGAYVATDVAGSPVLVSRGGDGVLRAFFNSCSHRGAIVVAEGSGRARRHSCPYHGWTYDNAGALVGVPDAADVGPLERSCLGLTELACGERAGLVWVQLRRDPVVDLDTFLCGYGDPLEHLRLGDCHFAGRQTLRGPNWKVAYDGYLDFYHLPVLHRDTFGPDMSTKALYHRWGPHQRVTSPDGRYAKLAARPEDQWTESQLVDGVWTIFPHVSIAAFDAGGKVHMVSQLFPGDAPGGSTTIQTFLHTQPPDDAQRELMAERMAFNFRVVNDEDYATGLRIQRSLQAGAKDVVLFGRNEGGGQRFHRFLDRLLATEDADVAELFAASAAETATELP
jgi:phenylpropionate dioxygenase-like ring-hydroxylating dioxygenase large terminal subunit